MTFIFLSKLGIKFFHKNKIKDRLYHIFQRLPCIPVLLSTCPSTVSSALLMIPNNSVLPAVTVSHFTSSLLHVATILCLSPGFSRKLKTSNPLKPWCQKWQRACQQFLQHWQQLCHCAPKALCREGDPASFLWGSKHSHNSISYTFDSSFPCSGNLFYIYKLKKCVYICVYKCVYIHTCIIVCKFKTHLLRFISKEISQYCSRNEPLF